MVVLGEAATLLRGYMTVAAHVVLMSTGRLLALDHTTLARLHDIDLCDPDEQGWAQLQTRNVLFVHTRRRTFYIALDEPAAAAWTVAVNHIARVCTTSAAPAAGAGAGVGAEDVKEVSGADRGVVAVPGGDLYAQLQSLAL